MGLKLLPYVADKPSLHCNTCQHGDKKKQMGPIDHHVRLLRGCGFLPPSPQARPDFEVPDADLEEGELTVCPGYAIGLPEVAETVHFRPSWSKGYLAEHLGEPPTPQMLEAQNALEGAINAKQAKEMRERAEEGRRNGK